MISKKNSARFFLIVALVLILLLVLFAQRRTSRIETALREVQKTDTVSQPPRTTEGAGLPADPVIQTQLDILDEIFASKNENDPRIDGELKVLSHAAKIALRKKYASLQLEKRNQRGMIVFLLGRNLTQPDDFEFLKSVVTEPACLDLADCNKSPTSHGPSGNEDHQAGQAATLAYPQLVAVKSVERFLTKKNQFPGELVEEALDFVKTAQSSASLEVRAAANRIQD